jgi:hypothetical protein
MDEKNEKLIHGKITFKAGKAHIPVIVRKELAASEAGYIIDAKTVVLCNLNMSPEELIKSLELLIEHLKLKSGRR